jgi:cupin fold WbuC family metalloprotein
MLLDDKLLDNVIAEARSSDRLRKNFNLHQSLDSKVQRLFNAMEPGTIVPIQRHQNTEETLILIKGRLRIDIYDSNKQVLESCILDTSKGNYGYHIPTGVWHSVEVLESGTVLFEVKEGPYASLSEDDILK